MIVAERYASRVLPPAEWSRLADTDIPSVFPYVTPETMRVIVVEDGDRIVAACALLTIVHLEGLWVHPEYRHKPGVARRLLTATLTLARSMTRWAMTAAQDDTVRRLLTKHLGAVHVPGDMYIVPIKEK